MKVFFTNFSKSFRIFFFGTIIVLPQLIFAQTTIWANMDSDPTTAGKRYIIPQKYRVLRLDIAQLKTMLNRSPIENTAAARSSTSVLELPMPDGGMQRFSIFESPIMEDGLAKKFPDIKTYGGNSLDKVATTIRFDVTPAGFHAMVLSPEGTFFIDPYSNGTTEYYISYAKKDFVSNKVFSCGVEPENLPIIEPKNKIKPQNAPDPLDFSDNEDIGNRFGDCVLRTYRLALAATGEYTTFHGGTVAGALAGQVTSMNRVNGVYERDLAVRMIIVANNNLIVYTDGATDPYTNNNGSTMLGQNQTNLDAVIGTANYDIGHVFSTGGGGVASLRSPCSATLKARGVTGSPAPVGDAFDIDYVAHEMGHQFGGNHSYNNSCSSNRNSSTAWEPGSGTTIMGYAGICAPDIQSNSDAYFHGGNLSEMQTFITGSGNTCSTKPAYTNAFPAIVSSTSNQTVPKGTPIVLTGRATDADGNASITYCWEQMDIQIATQPPVNTATGGPSFRSFNPSLDSSRYFPRLADLVNNVSPTWEVLPNAARTLSFRLVVRDNAVGGGCNDHIDRTLTVDATSGPLAVTIPTVAGISWVGLTSQTVTWDVANTNVAPVSCTEVDILLSTDGGLTYPTILASNVTNSGTAIITLPNLATATARIMVKGTGRAFFDISNNNFTITAGGPCTPPIVTVPTVTQPTCATPTGTIVVIATGSGTLEYSINDGASYQASATFLGLASGNYNIKVRLQASPTCVGTYVNNPVVINAVAGAPTAPSVGTITQPTCAVATGSVVLNGLPSTGTWTLTRSPGAVTTTGTGTSTTINGLAANTYTYTVTNAAGCTSQSSTNIVINAQPVTPTAPSVGTITQTTCAVATGSVILNGLPSTGTWTLTRSPGAVTTTGTGTSTTISGLSANTYTYTVMNAAGCTSAASANILINAQPITPTAPSVGTITQPTCTVVTGSVVLNGLPSTGTWTLTRSPGAVTSTGTGASTTISGLAPSTYTYTVTNSVGCTSSASANIVIDGSLVTPTPPSVGIITQPTCSVATGSVVLNSLPATGTWILTRSPGAVTSTGTGTSTTISGLTANTYTYTVTNATGCVSSASANIVINAQPATPSTPSVGVLTQPNCTVQTGSVVLGGLPSGSWTINPGNITGTGTSTTVSGLAANTYNFMVTNAVGCTSTPTTGVVINAAVGCCSNTISPTITLTSPTNNSFAVTNKTFTATAADADGSVIQVNFYLVTGISKTGAITRSLLGSDNSAPYSFDWTNIVGGNYSIQAEAIDNCGARTFSAINTLNVLETYTVLITSPVSGQSVVPGSNLNITAAVVAYTSRTVAKVEFYKDDVKIGEDLTAPYNFLLTNVPSGGFTLSSKAVDNMGGIWSSPFYYFLSLSVPNGAASSNNVSDNLLQASPNPAHSQVVLNMNVAQEGEYRLSISNMVGKTMVSKKAIYNKGTNTETFEVSTLPKGVYIIHLKQSEGNNVVVQKLIID